MLLILPQVQLSASLADSYGLIPLLHPTTGQAMSFVANEVKIQGISGGISNLKIDFVGHKYKKTETYIENEDLDNFLDHYLYEARLEKQPGKFSYSTSS